MRVVLFMVFAWTLLSCSPEKKADTVIRVAELQSGCFGFSGDGKTVSLQITEAGRQVKGNLVYDIVGKEQIAGTIEGYMEEDILVGTYTYRSSGLESTRGIAFKVDGNGFREGYGILNADGSSFENPQYLNFTASRQLRPTDCSVSSMVAGADANNLYSQVRLSLFDPMEEGVSLVSLSTDNRNPAYLLFNSDKTKAEIFFENQRNSMVLKKTHDGNWANSQYTLRSWKGQHTLYHETTPIFANIKKGQKASHNLVAGTLTEAAIK